MSVQVQGIPFNRILTFPFRNKTAVRRSLIGIGLVLACFIIPILPGLFVGGYSVRLLRRAIREGEAEMPEWSDESGLLMDGLRSAVVGLAYLLPGLAALIASFILYFVSFAMILPGLEDPRTLSLFTPFIPLAILFIGMSLAMVLLFAGAVPYPVALCRLADEGRLGAAFQFGEIFKALKKNPIGYIGAWIVGMGFMYIFYFIYFIGYMTVILCCPAYILFLAGAAGSGFIFLAMTGLAYREGKAGAQVSPGA